MMYTWIITLYRLIFLKPRNTRSQKFHSWTYVVYISRRQWHERLQIDVFLHRAFFLRHKTFFKLQISTTEKKYLANDHLNGFIHTQVNHNHFFNYFDRRTTPWNAFDCVQVASSSSLPWSSSAACSLAGSHVLACRAHCEAPKRWSNASISESESIHSCNQAGDGRRCRGFQLRIWLKLARV